MTLLPFLIAIPLCFWILLSAKRIREQRQSVIFIILSLLLLITNPQVRYLLAIAPIIIILATPVIDKKTLKWYLCGSLLLILLCTTPYILQIGGTINGELYGAEITGIINQGIDLTQRDASMNFQENLNILAHDLAYQTILVGNGPDDYAVLAHFYWGSDSPKFVSIQDYTLAMNNQTVLYSKRFEPIPNIPERRQFWVEGGLEKSSNDATNYSSIIYGVGFGEPLKVEGFSVVKKYGSLYLSKKVPALNS